MISSTSGRIGIGPLVQYHRPDLVRKVEKLNHSKVKFQFRVLFARFLFRCEFFDRHDFRFEVCSPKGF